MSINRKKCKRKINYVTLTIHSPKYIRSLNSRIKYRTKQPHFVQNSFGHALPQTISHQIYRKLYKTTFPFSSSLHGKWKANVTHNRPSLHIDFYISPPLTHTAQRNNCTTEPHNTTKCYNKNVSTIKIATHSLFWRRRKKMYILCCICV